MKYVLGIAMLLASAYCWQLSNGHSEEAVNFIEKQQELGLPVPIWMILLGLGLLFIIWGLRSRKVQGGLAPVTIQQQAPSLSSKKKTVSNELYAGDDWREKVRSQVEAMDTPSGVSLHIDLIKNVPLTLRLDRTTPENTRRSLNNFATLLAQIPTPPRCQVIFANIITSGIPLKNQVQGSFRRVFRHQSMVISSQEDRVDIRFSQPDDRWKESGNLFTDFA